MTNPERVTSEEVSEHAAILKERGGTWRTTAAVIPIHFSFLTTSTPRARTVQNRYECAMFTCMHVTVEREWQTKGGTPSLPAFFRTKSGSLRRWTPSPKAPFLLELLTFPKNRCHRLWSLFGTPSPGVLCSNPATPRCSFALACLTRKSCLVWPCGAVSFSSSVCSHVFSAASFVLDELWARAPGGPEPWLWEQLVANGLQHPCDLYCRLLLFSMRRGLLPVLEGQEPVHCLCFCCCPLRWRAWSNQQGAVAQAG